MKLLSVMTGNTHRVQYGYEAQRSTKALWRFTATLIALSLAGCAHQFTLPDSVPAASLGEAGTVLVSPTMVAPWDEVSATLKPAFALTGDQAASQVLPTTESISEQVLSAFGASLAVGLPTTATTSKTIVGGTSPGTTSTTEKNSGTAPTIANTIPSTATLPSAPSATATLGLDPGLKYKAANYLLQEVQLLNQEIENAASRSCYVPYVVKLKLAVMNFRPRLPYSVHMHMGFFYNGALPSNTRAIPPTGLPTPSPELAPECQVPGTNPAVIPLLVADDVQTALKARAAEAASQLAFGLSALVQGAGIAANAGSLQQSLTAISNHDLTSTLTIGRESESSLYALITPNNQASNQASLVSQTYDVAVLLLVPRFYFSGVVDPQSPTISVTTFSEYRNASTGEILPDGSTAALSQQAERVIPRHLTPEGLKVWESLPQDLKAFEAKRLAEAVKKASPQLFLERVSCQEEDKSRKYSKLCQCPAAGSGVGSCFADDDFRPALWTDLSSFLDYDVTKLSLLQARLPTPIRVPSQRIVLNDDGNNPVQAVLGGVSARSVAKLGAFLDVTPFDVKTWKSEASVTIPAQSLTLDANAHTVTVAFPSLKKLNITCLAPIDIPPRPPNPPASTKGHPAVAPVHKPGTYAPTPTQPAGTPEEPRDPDCPVRSPDAGSIEHPNGIVLRLIGCDQSREICPSLTDTSITAEEREEWLATKKAHLSTRQSLLEQEIVQIKGDIASAKQKEQTPDQSKGLERLEKQEKVLELRSPKFAEVVKKMGEVEEALASERKVQVTLASAAAAEKDKFRGPFEKARAKRETTSGQLRAAVIEANLNDSIEDHATIGVTLFSSQKSTNPAKVALSNTGLTIPYDSSGTGQLVVTLTPTPATDTMSVTVSGASLKSVLDASGVAVPFNAKHGFVLPNAGVYTLNLTSLNDKHPVTLTGQAFKGDAADGVKLTQTYQPTPPDQKANQRAATSTNR